MIDCGKHKTRDCNGTTGMESLTIQDLEFKRVHFDVVCVIKDYDPRYVLPNIVHNFKKLKAAKK